MNAAHSNITQQIRGAIDQLASVLDAFDLQSGSPDRLDNPIDAPLLLTNRNDNDIGLVLREIRPALPDSALVRQIIRHRKRRDHFFGAGLFADPAWDMLLDLAAARVEHTRVSVSSLCIASGVPPTTALRWITQMIDAGLLRRVDDDSDRRRAFIELSDTATDAMARYFQSLGKTTATLA